LTVFYYFKKNSGGIDMKKAEKTRGQKKKKANGRPKIKIDFKKVQLLAGMFCTGEEIAAVLDISYDTLERRTKEEYGIAFADYIKKYNENGKASLRRMQYKAASEGNATLLVWLGKQFLGQTDKQDLNHSGNIVIQEVRYDDDTDTI